MPHALQHPFGDVAATFQQLHAHAALCLPHRLLLTLRVGMAQVVARLRLFRRLVLLQQRRLLLRRAVEEPVVEVHHAPQRPVVLVHHLHPHGLVMCRWLRQRHVVQQLPVAASPAIDALFHVAHDDVVRDGVGVAVVEQHLEVLPLHATGVLKLVDHDVTQRRTRLLVHKRRVGLVLNEPPQQRLRVAQLKAVHVTVLLTHLVRDALQ